MKILKTIKKLINTLKDIEKYKNEIKNYNVRLPFTVP